MTSNLEKRKSTLRHLVILTASVLSFSFTSAKAAELVAVPTDPSARYSIVVQDVGLGRRALMVISKRDGSSGTSYSIREVNCLNGTFRYMGEGDTLSEATASVRDDAPMSQLVQGSISYYIVQASCD